MLSAKCLIFGWRLIFLKDHKITILWLTHKHLETHGCILSTVATDVLVLKHQDISIHSTDQSCIALDQFHTKQYIYCEKH